MKEPKDLMTKKQQWISFAFGIVLIILFAPSFLDFWKSQEKSTQVVMVIVFLPILIIMIFSGAIYKKHPKFWELLTGHAPQTSYKNRGLLWKDLIGKQTKIRLIGLIVIIIGIVTTLLIKWILK